MGKYVICSNLITDIDDKSIYCVPPLDFETIGSVQVIEVNHVPKFM